LDQLQILTPFGTELKNKPQIFTPMEQDLLTTELSNIDHMIDSLQQFPKIHQEISYLLPKFKDIRQSLKQIQQNRILDEVELYELKFFSYNLETLIRKTNLFNDFHSGVHFQSLSPVFELLDPNQIELPTFQIYSSYSESL
jgi:DNA mismatch repair protein MutS2